MPRKIFLIALILFCSACAGPRVIAPHPSDLQLRVEPAAFSPNGDGLQDQTFFTPVLQNAMDITRWRIDIRRPSGKVVRRMSGAGLSSLVPWDGLDNKGNAAPEGDYVAVLTLWAKGPTLTAQAPVTVDVTPPVSQISVSTPVFDKAGTEGGALVFVPEVGEAHGLGGWQLQILSVEGRTVELFSSTEALRDISWDGRDRTTDLLVPPGTYRCAFQAWDKAGNEGSPAFIDVTMSVTPRQMMKEALHKLKVNECEAGLLVQLRSQELFVERARSIQLREEGKDLLREAAVLINAYPDVPVTLTGFSSKKKGASARDHSSLYAWSVYSFLVKQGGVKPSRLTVRGQGSSPLDERKKLDVPLLLSGVEVTLEGHREW